jgi:hypothetical protein
LSKQTTDFKSERAPPKVYESPNTYLSNFMTKVKVFEKKVKDERVKVMVSNERSYQME